MSSSSNRLINVKQGMCVLLSRVNQDMSSTVSSTCLTSCAMASKERVLYNGACKRLLTNSIGNSEVKRLFTRCNWIIDRRTKESISFIRCEPVLRWTCTLNFSTKTQWLRSNGINSACDLILAFLNQLVTFAQPTYSIRFAKWAIHNIRPPHSITVHSH